MIKKRLGSAKGFTLIELMAVLAILALIAIIAVPAIGAILSNAGDQADGSTTELFEKAASVAYLGDGATTRVFSKEPDITGAPDGYTVQKLIDRGFVDYDGPMDGKLVLTDVTDSSSFEYRE